ncbi:MAG: ATP-dependent RecD-like DNA helicase [Croceivirga sp.]
MNALISKDFHKILVDKFPHRPTALQGVTLQKIADFIFSKDSDELFLLKGYAGTGKTTIIGGLVKHLWHTKMKAVLMAPTGRAAKVISNYSGTQALTIHKKIYFPKKQSGGGVQFVLAPNKHRNTLFIVDEASMIPDTPADSKLFENGSLLDDLMYYVYSGHNCKLVLIGDTAQLPPIKIDVSPALEAERIELNYNKNVTSVELDEVMRQSERSGILFNATNLRQQLQNEYFEKFQFVVDGFPDIHRLIDGHEIQEAINDAYARHGKEGTALIVRSNKRANLYNLNIRARILFLENEIAVGDFMMVVKNNYFWLKPNSEAGFIANGDIIEILELFAIKDLYGFRFAEVKVQMVDYPNQKPFETVLMLDTITAETPSLAYEDGNRLYQEVLKDYANEKSKYRQFMGVKNNSFFNALQVKFSYAITCHKSQGGQWNTVFVEQPFLRDGVNKEYLRWLYTAVTRTKENLFLIGFKDDFFVES